MSYQFQRELSNLRKNLLALGALVEDMLTQAVVSLLNRDGALGDQHGHELRL